MDRRVERIDRKVERAEPGREIERDARVLGDERRQARREPACAESGQDGEIEGAAVGVGAKFERRRGDALQRVAHLGGVGAAGDGELHRLTLAQEQRRAERLLEQTDLPADGALRQAQLLGRGGEAFGPRRRLESAQVGHRGEKSPRQGHRFEPRAGAERSPGAAGLLARSFHIEMMSEDNIVCKTKAMAGKMQIARRPLVERHSYSL